MARIRSIKPEFWTDPDVVAMPMAARLFFVGCWNHADDYGVLRDDPERLRLQIMPADPIDAAAIVDELVERRHLVRMTAPDGTKVLVVRTFCVHQKIDKRAVGRWGEPADFQPIPTDPDHTPPIPTNPTPGREGKGQEGTSLKDSSAEADGHTDPAAPPAAKRTAYPAEFEAWYKHYPRKIAKGAALKAWRNASKHINADDLIASTKAHAHAWAERGDALEFIPHPSTWLNDRRYDDEPPTGQRAPADKPDRNMAKIHASVERARNGTSAFHLPELTP